uniref:Nucleoporin 210 like n=1 Tax=Lepisosteus oculatus TaxID=7918 RepID=W5MIB4_LEPOC
MSVEPEERWALQTGRVYQITVGVHDRASHAAQLSENVRIAVELSELHFETLLSSPNGSYHVVQTLRPGRALVRAALGSITTENGMVLPLSPPISHQQEVEIYSPIVLMPSVVALPWHPGDGLYHYKIQVEGGSGNFSWASSNQSVAMVTVNGTVVTGSVLGVSIVEARDQQNPSHCGLARVLVLRPVKMQLLPQQGDCEVGGSVDLPLAVYPLNAQTPQLLTDCSLLPLDTHPDRLGVFEAVPAGQLGPGPGSCSGVRLEAVGPGHTQLTIGMATDRHYITATATLASYRPLRALLSDVLLANGAARDLLFDGGPQPWVLEPDRFFSDLLAEPGGGAQIAALRPPQLHRNQHAYRVTCTALGEQWLVFRSGNVPGPLNPRPSAEEVRVRVGCALPARLSLTPVSTSPPAPSPCPQPLYRGSTAAVPSSRDTVLELAAFDQQGAQFDNFTAEAVRWHSSNPSLLSVAQDTPMSLQDRQTGSGHAKLHGQSSAGLAVTVVMMAGGRGRAVLITLPPTVVNMTISLDHTTSKNNSDVVHLHLVSQRSPKTSVSGSLILLLVVLTSGRQILHAHGQTGTVTITASLAEHHDSANPVSIQVRTSPFPSFSYSSNPQAPLKKEVFSPDLKQLGESDSVIAIRTGLVEKQENRIRRHPFRLQPRRMALAFGSERQVVAEGGPHPRSSVTFTVSDSHVAVVTEEGLVRGVAVGTVHVRGVLQTVQQDTGVVTIFSEDEVEVEVFNLTSVRVQAPLDRLPVGAEMPVYVMGGSSSQTPLSFAGTEGRWSFQWVLDKPGVLEVEPRHAQTAVRVSPGQRFSVLVRAVSAGWASLRVTAVLVSAAGEEAELSDEIRITVFDEAQPVAGPSRVILMSPFSQHRLQTTRDGVSPLQYEVCQCRGDAGLVSVDRQGLVRSGSATGSAVLEIIVMEPCGVNQTILLIVKVSPVCFVRLTVDLGVHSSGEEGLPAFPLGARLSFRVLLYDSTGQRFDAHDAQLRFMPSRDDLIQISVGPQSQLFWAQPVSPGLTVLGVCDPRSPALCDYTPLLVLHALSPPPHSPLRPGHFVCFSTPLRDSQGRPGWWEVSSNQTLHIDPATGAALAKHAGTVVVYYRLEGEQQALREELVCSLHYSATCLQSTLQSVFTATPHYSADSDSRNNDALHREKGCCCPGSDGAQQGSTRPVPLSPAGQYSCVVAVQLHSQAARRALASAPLSVSLSAALRGAAAEQGRERGGHGVLPFLPAFYCNQSRLSLSPSQPVTELRVVGTDAALDSLRIQSDHPEVLLSDPVRSAEEPALLVVSVYPATLGLLQQEATHKLTLSSTMTEQTQSVVIAIEPEAGSQPPPCEDSRPAPTLLGSQYLLLFSVFAVLALTAGLYLVYSLMLARTQTVPVVYVPTSAHTYSGDAVLTRNPYWDRWTQLTDGTPRRRHWLWSTR